MAIAEEMGAALQHSASSVNIRERLDFSCALFDAAGNLVANAPHMPVHLGSMGDSIRAILRRRGPGPDGVAMDGRGMQPGDVYALNAPYDGGTHLPDVTVIMPVFVDGRDAPAFHVAARGHHADIGGITPGSMPPGSRSVEEEGVILDNLLVVDRGEFREAAIRDLLGSGPYPARNIDQNIADLSAQIAACAGMVDYLESLYTHHFGDTGATLTEKAEAVHDLSRQYEGAVLQPLLDYLAERNSVRLIGPRQADQKAPTVALHSQTSGETLAAALAAKGVMAGGGDFYGVRCLEGLGIDPDHGVLRLSFVHYTRQQDISTLLSALDEVL